MRQEPSPARRCDSSDRWVAAVRAESGSGACHGGGWRAASMAPYSTNTSSPKRDGTCGHYVVFCGSDQMLIRRFGSVPSQRLTLAFHTVPAPGGRRDSSSKFGHGMATSRLHPLSASFGSFSVPRSAVAIVTPVASKRLKRVRLL